MFHFNSQKKNAAECKQVTDETTKSISFILTLLSLIFVLIKPLPVIAEETSTTTAVVKMKADRSFGLSYLSWTENLQLDNGNNTDQAFANFYGNSLFYEKQFPTSTENGYSIELGMLAGSANAGGTQTSLSYQKSYVKWWGAESTARLSHQLSSHVVLSAGAMALYRTLTWPDQINGLSVKSGADFNLAALLDLKMNLSQNLYLKNTLGSMAFKATTYWALAIGYNF